MGTKRIALRVLAVFLLLGLLWAGSGCKPAATPTPAPAETPKPAAKEIVIGAIYPLSGALAPTGELLRAGVELAEEIINGKYPDLNIPLAAEEGLPNLGGAKIKVIFADHEASPEKGMSEAERLITEEKVVALIGCYNSSVTATASEVAERYKIPFVNGSSTSPVLHTRGLKYFFRTTPHDQTFAENFFQFLKDLKEEKGIEVKKIALVYEDTLWGSDVGKAEKELAEKYGYEVVADITYKHKTSEVTSEVLKLKGANPDVVMMASYISDAILYQKTFKEMDFNPPAILAMDAGHSDPSFVGTLGDDANYVLSREVWALDLAGRKPMVKTINDMFKERTGKNMDGGSARTFTALIVLADAINRAGSTDPEAIRKALAETDISSDRLIMPWEGIKFDPETGQNPLGRGIIVQIQNQKYVTVWPFDLAAAEVIWPMPKWSER
ncbi:MAG TPA: branched-chain amino acid ABC transporter substrate-binding protein [Chloroflexi bacterium]|nr:branched-chain amino acid ABC transporter substrate-binding protein [Chloroflexota bacterium]